MFSRVASLTEIVRETVAERCNLKIVILLHRDGVEACTYPSYVDFFGIPYVLAYSCLIFHAFLSGLASSTQDTTLLRFLPGPGDVRQDKGALTDPRNISSALKSEGQNLEPVRAARTERKNLG